MKKIKEVMDLRERRGEEEVEDTGGASWAILVWSRWWGTPRCSGGPDPSPSSTTAVQPSRLPPNERKKGWGRTPAYFSNYSPLYDLPLSLARQLEARIGSALQFDTCKGPWAVKTADQGNLFIYFFIWPCMGSLCPADCGVGLIRSRPKAPA